MKHYGERNCARILMNRRGTLPADVPSWIRPQKSGGKQRETLTSPNP